jgi:hypothetical protein
MTLRSCVSGGSSIWVENGTALLDCGLMWLDTKVGY